MSYFNQQIIDQYITTNGIQVIVREGLNNKNDWELRLVIPKKLQELWNRDDRFIYTKKPVSVAPFCTGWMYFAEDTETGRVRYFFYDKPGKGFGGSTYNLPMINGSTDTLIGPWSSNSKAMNERGHTPSKEVNIDGKYNMASAMSVRAINELLLPLNMECLVLDDDDPIIIRL